MKKHKLLNLVTIAALSSTIFAGSTTTFADEVRRTDTEADISFVEGDTDEEIIVDPPVDPEIPGIIIPPVEPETNRGPLTIAYVPDISFGTQAISVQDQHYSALASEFYYSDGEGEISEDTQSYIHFAQVQDTRGSHEGWHLTVAISEFTNLDVPEAMRTLRGAELNFRDGAVVSSGLEDQRATAPELVTLVPGSGATKILNAAQGQGAGVQSIYWGEVSALETEEVLDEEGEVVDTVTTNPSVTLFVPRTADQGAARYRANLNWSLTAGPDSDFEG